MKRVLSKCLAKKRKATVRIHMAGSATLAATTVNGDGVLIAMLKSRALDDLGEKRNTSFGSTRLS